jgi:hypothetical protein
MLPSGNTGSGESVTATVISASGVVYVVLSISMLSVLSGSLTPLPTLKLVEIVPSLIPLSDASA